MLLRDRSVSRRPKLSQTSSVKRKIALTAEGSALRGRRQYRMPWQVCFACNA